MSCGDPIPKSLWAERYAWIRSIDEAEQHPLGSYLLSSHGVFLAYDIDIAFCAGAWVSVIILAHASIDATIRDTESGDYASNSKVVFGADPDLEWLRKRRNSLVHVREGYDPSNLDTIDTFHDTLEIDARRAMNLVYRTIYANPGT
ncbi:MAG: hypothetical protein JWQ71_1282 [Pedosphaera sp.]|nr:hypothetical protein [Pedosphaera sp.]